MKKKLLYGVALTLMASVSVGTLQSCKDDVNDLRTQTSYDLYSLNDQVKAQYEELKGLIEDLQKFNENNEGGYVTEGGLSEALDAALAGLLGGSDGESFQQALNTYISNYLDNNYNPGTGSGPSDAEINNLIQKYLTDHGYVPGGGSTGLTEAQVQQIIIKYLNDNGYKPGGGSTGLTEEQVNALIQKYLTDNGYKPGSEGLDADAVKTIIGQYLTDNGYVSGAHMTEDQVNQLIRTYLDNNLSTLLQSYATLDYIQKLLYGELPGGNAQTDVIDKGGLLAMIQGALDSCTCGDLTELKNNVDKLVKAMYPEGFDLEGKANMIEWLKGKLEAQDSYLKQLQAFIDVALDPTSEGYKTLSEKFQGIQDQIDPLKNTLEELTNEAKTGRVDVLETKVNELSTAINEIKNSINELTGRVDVLVTNVLIQRVQSPVFGDFSLPIGVQSNLAFNWYGHNDSGTAFDFPNDGTESEKINVNGAVGVKFSGVNGQINVLDGYYSDAVNLGKVYMTFNPVGHNIDLTNGNVKIVNSQGQPLNIDFNVAKSDDVLTFGYTRDKIDGSLYAGNVIVKGSPADGYGNLKSVMIEINDGLKSSMKDALKNPSKRGALELVKAVYDQMSGMLPAYGLRYDWTANYTTWDNEGKAAATKGDYSVLSKYELGVATAKPLGFNFLKGEGASSDKIPTISNIDNLIFKLRDEGLLEFKIKPIEIKNIVIEIKPIGIDASVKLDGKGFQITIPEITVYDNEGNVFGKTEKKTVDVKAEDLNDVYAAIKNGIEESLQKITKDIDKWTSDIQGELDDKINTVLSDIQKQLNEMIDDINGQVEDMVTNIGNKFQPYFDKVNRMIDLYNKVAGKVNSFLKNPNHYLQAAAFYESGSGVGILSGDPKNPTKFKMAGGNAFNVYLSTYSAELIAPAYKKYVAVTGVYNGGTKTTVATDAAPNAGLLNTVLDGSQIKVQVPAAGFQKNKVYEFTYQALDYNGFTSTRKFYIEIVNN